MNVFELFGTIAINNKGALSALKDTTERAAKAGKQIQEAFKKVGSATLKVGKVVGGAAVAVGSAWAATVESTRDYRGEMAKLDTAFTTNGHSAETATKTYRALQAVLGETDQAVEAANHLAVMCKTEEELANWTDICTGVYAQFGDSLPIEGLTESANETAKVGQVTGSLADALNWAGISEDDFNLKLKTCRNEQERQKLIMDTLLPTYKAQAESYKENAENIMKANTAQDNLNRAMAKIGDIGEPIFTGLKNWIADMVTAAAPHLETFASKLGEIASAWFGVEPPDLSTSLSTTVANVQSFATDVLTSLQSIFDWATGDGQALVTIVGTIAGVIALLNAPVLLLSVATAFLALNWNDVKTAVDNAFNATVDWLSTNIGGPVETFRQNVIAPLSEYWNTTVKGAITGAAASVGDFFGIDLIAGWDSITNAIAGAWNSVTSAIASAAAAVDSFMGNNGSNAPWYVKENPDKYTNYNPESSSSSGGSFWGRIFGGTPDSSNAVGLDRVPRDGYLIRAHKDETLLNKVEADAWRGGNTSGIEAKLDTLIAVMSGSRPVVLDSGAMVGQLAPAMDARLGTISSRKGRRN